jgi:double zinc ribbon protein
MQKRQEVLRRLAGGGLRKTSLVTEVTPFGSPPQYSKNRTVSSNLLRAASRYGLDKGAVWAARAAGDSGAENQSYNKATGRMFLNELASYLGGEGFVILRSGGGIGGGPRGFLVSCERRVIEEVRTPVPREKSMRCSNCGTENPEGLKFCNECAAPFKRRCAKCGFENVPTAKFCGECATPLNIPAADPHSAQAPGQVVHTARIADPESVVDGERKTVTALFADIKDSTEMMRDLDPEEARTVIDPVLRLMMDAVHRYDGYVVQSAGDGIFGLFGAPVRWKTTLILPVVTFTSRRAEHQIMVFCQSRQRTAYAMGKLLRLQGVTRSSI